MVWKANRCIDESSILRFNSYRLFDSIFGFLNKPERLSSAVCNCGRVVQHIHSPDHVLCAMPTKIYSTEEKRLATEYTVCKLTVASRNCLKISRLWTLYTAPHTQPVVVTIIILYYNSYYTFLRYSILYYTILQVRRNFYTILYYTIIRTEVLYYTILYYKSKVILQQRFTISCTKRYL